MKLDILAFGAHPDDIELSCSGLLLTEKANGKKTGVIDLTQGELGTRGSIEQRYVEAENAKKILSLDIRENLKFDDGFFENNKLNQLEIIKVLRKYKPEIVLCNAPQDRHPDHGKGASIVEDAAFLSGLVKIITQVDGFEQEPWRPKYVLNYIQDRYLKPDFIVDISNVFDKKIDSIKAYSTQFFNPIDTSGTQTYISTPAFLDGIVARAAMFGKMIGVDYAEGFISKKAIGISNLDSLILKNT